MYDTIIDMIEDIALSKYPIKEEADETTGIRKTIWVEDEYEFALIFDPTSEKYLFLQSTALHVQTDPILFEYQPDPSNGYRSSPPKTLTEELGRELFKDLTIVVRKAGYLGLYGTGRSWSRIIVDEPDTLITNEYN